MKNHVKGFGQFINERAKGDYFQAGSDRPEIYGVHQGGSGDFYHAGSDEFNRITSEDPDEEMSTRDFIDQYGEEIGDSGQDFLNRRPMDGQVKVFKNRGARPENTMAPSYPVQPKQMREFIKILQTNMENGKYLIDRKNTVAMIAHLKSELKGR